MSRSLRLRLTLTHTAVAALAIIVVAVIVHVADERRFERYLADVQERRNTAVVQALEDTYREGIGWGASAVFAVSQAARASNVNLAVYSPQGELEFTVQGIHGPSVMSGQMMGGGMGSGGGRASPAPGVSASPHGAAAYDVKSYPVVVGGTTVARVDVYAPHGARVAAEEAYEGSLTRNLVIAAAVAAGLALVISVLVSRRVTGPLEELTEAAGDVAGGNLDVRVAPRGQDEVATLSAAFNSMADALARDEQWRRDMTVDLAYELRTPLATIQSRVKALEDGVMPATPENLRLIGDEVERLDRLLAALRNLNELESEDLDVQFDPLDLAEVVSSAVTDIETEAARRDVTLVPEIVPVTVRGDRDRLLQVVSNLLDNALKSAPTHGTITVSLSREESSAVLSVADTGPGIDPVDLPFVCDRFYRSRSARGTQGAGLGLAIVKGLVEAHGGAVEAGNRPQGGAVFTVRLPLAG
ncbi:MAG TPA: HAMP domain-containing sensor histidine kinase [Thermoleophilia bacterium]|nr:HAMP domain-containing sensor histidine kinase [Thermoleophilia bacterium]